MGQVCYTDLWSMHCYHWMKDNTWRKTNTYQGELVHLYVDTFNNNISNTGCRATSLGSDELHESPKPYKLVLTVRVMTEVNDIHT